MSGSCVLYVSAHTTMFVGLVIKREKLFSTMNGQCGRTHYCLQVFILPSILAFWPVSGFGVSPSEGEYGLLHCWCWEWPHSLFWPSRCQWQLANLDPSPWETSPLSTHPRASGITWEERVWLAHWTKEDRMGDNWKGLEPILKLGANSQIQTNAN